MLFCCYLYYVRYGFYLYCGIFRGDGLFGYFVGFKCKWLYLSMSDIMLLCIVVVGSVNIDFVMCVLCLLVLGEMLFGMMFEIVNGGKGVN